MFTIKIKKEHKEDIVKGLCIPPCFVSTFLSEAFEKEPSEQNILRAQQKGRVSLPAKGGA